MLDGRCLVLIAVGLCLTASGCQDGAPASVTHVQSANLPSGRLVKPAAGEDRAGLGCVLGENASQSGDGTPERDARPLPAVPLDGRAIAITFDDLQLEMKEDSAFNSSMLTTRVKALDGRRVRIRGFIYPAVLQQTGITKFPLIKNTQCKFGPGGLAHHIILVDLRPGLSTSFTVRPIAIEGLLTVRPFNGPDGTTWTIYHMAGDKVD